MPRVRYSAVIGGVLGCGQKYYLFSLAFVKNTHTLFVCWDMQAQGVAGVTPVSKGCPGDICNTSPLTPHRPNPCMQDLTFTWAQRRITIPKPSTSFILIRKTLCFRMKGQEVIRFLPGPSIIIQNYCHDLSPPVARAIQFQESTIRLSPA